MHTRTPFTIAHPDAQYGSSCDTVGLGSDALGLVGSLLAHAPSVITPPTAPARRRIRADRLTLIMERSVREGALYLRRTRTADGYAG